MNRRFFMLFPALGGSLSAMCGKECCRRGHGQAEAAAGEAKAKDPVCGMDVDPAKALKAEHGGKAYYFCNPSCRDKFVKNPDQYVKKTD